tara:strand:- start:141 stop:461 length:321 start_codon:yes stop_codon:yes gene_type:complete
MAKGYKTGGRVKGKPNKAQAEVAERLTVLDCDPIEGMAIIARESMAAGDHLVALNAYKELAQYVAPKRKSIEMTTHVTYEDRLRSMSEDELDEELREMKIDPANLQ